MYDELNEGLESLRKKWIKKFKPTYGPPPPELPPLWAVNHSIPLINPDARYMQRQPRCPTALMPLLREKTQRYLQAGWWKLAHGRNAIPLLSIPKAGAELRLRTVVDARECNANTIIDSTPLPNQDLIRDVVASHKYVSVIDMSDAYEQMHVEPEEVPRTLFSSPFGMFISNNLQQGDGNGPSSWQRLMTYMFHERIAVQVWVYIDDIYIFTNTIPNHENALEYVLKCLIDDKLYISPKKLRPYTICFNQALWEMV